MSSITADAVKSPASAVKLDARDAQQAASALKSVAVAAEEVASGVEAKRKEQRIVRAVPYPFVVAFSAAGFVIAAIINLVFPQVAPVEFKQGQIWIFLLNGQEAYLFLLAVLTVLYVVIGVVDGRNPKDAARFRYRAQFRFVAGLALALWDVTGTKLQVLPQPFFPGPSQVMEPFVTDGAYVALNTFYSVRLFAAGFASGVILGVLTGVLIGWFARAYYWVFPVLKITGVIPAVAWMPFALTLMPTPFIAAVFLLLICSWFPVAFLTAQGIQSTPKMLVEASRTLGAKTPYILFHVAIPHAMPSIFTGIGMANSLSFLTLVISEMMGQPGGLGYYIDQAKAWSAYNEILAAIVVMAVLFSLIMKLLEVVRGRVLRWQKGLVK
ncbi:ABC transporter permease [Bifidobacterium felsineum]|uniref:ABC transporter permease n=1 Tax=Bifidobacterium felsineum TaxID=2045440 RepID=A0A2M9HIZ6_9BIFI|nr:ABC transporter permease [Bifidobacterium felsineum]MBT1164540.1 ABC transporter permease [Bifidobacterium felsineum]PJM76790.1 ABC transporter permease [Bifidobacterium felsineum]